MLLKPNDLPPLELGEERNLLFKLGGAVGANTIDSFTITATPARLSFGDPTITESNVTVMVNADVVGSYTLLATAVLSSAEKVIGRVRVKVMQANACHSTRDYYDG